MKNYPKISLVTACYNHKDYIAQTIESVLSQNYPNLQYVVIDDGSTDGSWDIIKKYESKLFHCERLEGYRESVTTALNYGIFKTDGEIMGWINSDDILLSNSLFTVADVFISQPSVEWLTGVASTINYKTEIVNSRLVLKNIYDYLIGNWQVIQQESTFWRRSLWERAGGRLLEKKWAFDTELWTRFFKEAEHYHLSAPIGAFRRGQQSKSVSNRASFTIPSLEYVNKMVKDTEKKRLAESIVYRVCKNFLWPILIIIPNRFFVHIPLFKKFAYKVIEYSFEDNSWNIFLRNPFRRY